jgi:hypothetical protein
MPNVDIRVPSQCGTGCQIESWISLLRLFRDGIWMIESRGYREIPGAPAGMEFIRFGVELVKLLALQGCYLRGLATLTLTQH